MNVYFIVKTGLVGEITTHFVQNKLFLPYGFVECDISENCIVYKFLNCK